MNAKQKATILKAAGYTTKVYPESNGKAYAWSDANGEEFVYGASFAIATNMAYDTYLEEANSPVPALSAAPASVDADEQLRQNLADNERYYLMAQQEERRKLVAQMEDAQDISETQALRQQVASLEAENARLKAALEVAYKAVALTDVALQSPAAPDAQPKFAVGDRVRVINFWPGYDEGEYETVAQIGFGGGVIKIKRMGGSFNYIPQSDLEPYTD